MQPYTAIPPSVVNSPAHQDLALSAARQGMVLLKNSGGKFPLSASSIKSLAVVGPNGATSLASMSLLHFYVRLRLPPSLSLSLQLSPLLSLSLFLQRCTVSVDAVAA
jgi:hypothetical protein